MKKINFTFLGKKYRKIILIVIGFFLIVGIAYATFEKNRRVDNHTYYRINNGVTLNIDRGAKCRKVKNTSGVSYFIPIKTNTEWYSFVNNKPSGVTIYNECYIPKGYDKGSSFWMSGPYTSLFTVCYHGYCVEGNTSGESAEIYRYWWTNRAASTYERPGWKVKRGSLHHSASGLNYYYVTISE